ncbi:hypothetical protein HS125_01955 [bacterium]|nr:hypothetical protein [bacterium]
MCAGNGVCEPSNRIIGPSDAIDATPGKRHGRVYLAGRRLLKKGPIPDST